jgi:uncharacterized protein YifE (UPF0438 family)
MPRGTNAIPFVHKQDSALHTSDEKKKMCVCNSWKEFETEAENVWIKGQKEWK